MIQTINREGILTKLLRFPDCPFGSPNGEHLLLVEVGNLVDYDHLHLRRALHLPPDRIEQTAGQLLPDHGAVIVLYAQNLGDPAAKAAASKLASMGYFNLYVYPGGKQDWTANSLWTETSSRA